jgi:ATP-dependent DNA ligase
LAAVTARCSPAARHVKASAARWWANNDRAGDLIYAGKVETAFNDQVLRDLFKRMQPLTTTKRPFKNATEHDRRSHWVEPKLVCEVVFTEWPPDGSIQHPSFKGLRTHKPAKAIVREEPVATR